MDYITLKNKVIDKYFSRMNDMQKKAVYKIDGALLITAGAGSGKTTVLCSRIANMILFGRARSADTQRDISPEDAAFAQRFLDGDIMPDEAAQRLSDIFGENRIDPWRILVVTFTNKAAGELKTRLSDMGASTEGIWAATFHSACVRILRSDIENLNMGYRQAFAIYDTQDTQKVIKGVMKDLNISEKALDAKTVQNTISRAKDKLISPERFSIKGQNSGEDYLLSNIKRIYTEYQKRLIQANALDFDDIIVLTVKLFETCPDSLDHWHRRFTHIMVDEYQDTNTAQYRLISLLAGKDGNLCVVGDEDQSIYRFRGATIENILSFEEEFGAQVIKLEQNYRSTSNILSAANAVISNNTQHKDKTLWSDLGDGEKLNLHRFSTEEEEAMFVADSILDGLKAGKKYSSNAVLYRGNAQSRSIETALAKNGIPYSIIGGIRFFERKEIKDILSYLSVIENPYDEVRFMRIINEPLRGIGTATQEEISRIARGLDMSFTEVLLESVQLPSLSKKAKVLLPLGEAFEELSAQADDLEGGRIIDEILERFGYKDAMLKQGLEGETRLDNIYELKTQLIKYAEENPDGTLAGFLEQVSLVSDLDSLNGEEDRVVLMTMHAAKGLEFDTVFVVGAEENVFPGYRSQLDPMEIEEERRLCYVAITRAKRSMYFTCAKQRMLYGQTQRNKVSRFVAEIPARFMNYHDAAAEAAVPQTYTKQYTAGGTKNGNYLSENYNRKSTVGGKAYIGGNAGGAYRKTTPQTAASYGVGDRVRHGSFGDGTVISVKPMGNDHLLEIAFDTQGTKKIAANFAKIKKI